MSQWVLVENGSVLPVQTLRSLTESELESKKEEEIRRLFDDKVKMKYGDYLAPPANWAKRRRREGDDELDDDPLWNKEVEDEVIELDFPHEDNFGMEHQVPEIDDIPDLDQLIGAECILPQGGATMQAGKVIGRVVDDSGRPVGTFNKDPLLDSRVYEVMFPDGNIEQYAANLIAESIYMNCDDEGRRSQIMDGIVEFHRSVDALRKDEAITVGPSGDKRRIKTTKGWKFLVKWKDGSNSWVPLKDVKESYPIDVVEYAVEMGIQDEPAFSWWIPHVLRKRRNIVSAVKSRMRRKTHKFGIEVPMTVGDALRLDKEVGAIYWCDAIAKEMGNVQEAFDMILEDDEVISANYSKMTVHLIFDACEDGPNA